MCPFFWHKATVSAVILIVFQNSSKDRKLNRKGNSSVYFSGFVDLDKVENYSANRLKYAAKGRGAQFTEAVEKMDEYISDQLVCAKCNTKIFH